MREEMEVGMHWLCCLGGRAAATMLVGAIATAGSARPETVDDSCFLRPTQACVLALAQEAARPSRDWRAYRAIGKAQARTRRYADALATLPSIPYEAARSGVRQVIAETQAHAGSVEDAFATVRSIPPGRPRIDAFTALGAALAMAKRPEAAEKAFAEARDLVLAIPDPRDRAAVLYLVARAQTEAGQARAALPAARALGFLRVRVERLGDIARALALAGHGAEAETVFAEALGDARSNKDPHELAWGLAKMGLFLGQARKAAEAAKVFREALEAARADASETMRYYDLRDIAEAIEAVGVADRAADVVRDALALAQSATSAGHRIGLIGHFARAQAKSPGGKGAAATFRMAFEAAQAVPDRKSRASLVSGIAEAQAEVGYIEDAIATTAAIPAEAHYPRASALAAIAKAQAEAGRFAEAVATAHANPDAEWYRDAALKDVALAQVAAGKLAEAVTTARLVGDRIRRVSLLRAIGAAQIRADQTDAAMATLREALALTRGSPFAGIRAETYAEIAEILPR